MRGVGRGKGTLCLEVSLGHPVAAGHNMQIPGTPVWELDTRLTTLLYKIIIVEKSKEVKTGWYNSRKI
jgi:hypothetical protein